VLSAIEAGIPGHMGASLRLDVFVLVPNRRVWVPLHSGSMNVFSTMSRLQFGHFAGDPKMQSVTLGSEPVTRIAR